MQIQGITKVSAIYPEEDMYVCAKLCQHFFIHGSSSET